MRDFIFTSLMITAWTINVFAQGAPCQDVATLVDEKGDTVTISIAEKAPYLKEGMQSYATWVKNNADKKLISKKKEEKKTVYVSFVVEVDGSTSDFKIDKGLGDLYDKEALRLIMNMPLSWVAGECANKKVRTRTTVPVKF